LTPQPPIAAGDRFPIVAGESSAPESGLPALSDAARGRLQAMFRDQYTFIWRVLRRLGVAPEDVDDAAQQVFMVAARRMEDIDAGSERAFLFGSALRIATGARRGRASRLASDDTALEVQVDPGPSPEQITERKRALQVLDEVLDAMPFELRTVFVLFELEGMSMQDIAQALELPRGTVASRLRRAREEFHGHAARLRARAQFRGGQP
jgi:RNA polymerase sigma-70 factor (ECF subfamily)